MTSHGQTGARGTNENDASLLSLKTECLPRNNSAEPLGRTTIGNPRDSIHTVFDALERWFRSRTFRGCALTNAVGERGDTLVIAGPITLKHKRALLDWFVRAAADANAADPRLLGEQLMLLFDGALTGATTRRSAVAAPSARRAAEVLLDCSTGSRG